jgi:hypothetical protein
MGFDGTPAARRFVYNECALAVCLVALANGLTSHGFFLNT